MVRGLVERLLTVLRQVFTAEIIDIDDHVVAGPVPAPAEEDLPLIALSPGELTLEPRVKDEATGQPRPRDRRQEIAVSETAPAGPYPLAQTPLADSLRCRIVFDKGELEERSVALREGHDFTIDPTAPSISFTYGITGADEIQLSYSVVGVFVVRELCQDLLADVYGKTVAAVERLSSLVTGIVLIDQNVLLEQVNRVAPTSYGVGRYATLHLFDRLVLLDGTAIEVSNNVVHQRLHFRATGRLEATRALEDGFGLIERVHSPGRVSEHPVDIEPEVLAGSKEVTIP